MRIACRAGVKGLQDRSALEIDRRGLIAVFGGAGLALGMVAREATAAVGASPSRLGPYIEITPDGRVCIYTPGAEMGQGVHDGLPKIVAEELACDWSRVDVRLSYASAEFAPPGGRQRSADSDAVMNYYHPLRLVGASAREMLTSAAAARWQVEPASIVARRGVLIHEPTGRSLAYGDVAAQAARLTPPQTPSLKDAKTYELIGRTTPRKDIPAKVDGSAVFGIDVEQPGMLYAAIRHPPQFGGDLSSVDLAAVRSQTGVKAAMLLDGGEAAVVADSFWRARKAVEGLSVPTAAHNPLSSDAIRQQMIAGLNADAGALPFPTFVDRGPFVAPAERSAVEALIAGAPRQLDEVYEVPYLAHATLEPPCCTALVEPGRCTVWAPHQNATTPHKAVADYLGLPLEAVRFNRTFLGGGFGRKNDLDFVLQCVQLAKAVPGRPIKLIWTREEDIRHGSLRPAFMVRTRAGLDGAGRPVAMLSRMCGQPAAVKPAYGIPGMANATAAAELIAGAYGDFPRRIEYVELSLPVRTGYWRSVTGSQNGFFSEVAIDELAALAGKDAVEFRAALLGRRPRTLAVLRRVAERAGWGASLPAGVGRGVALFEGYGSFCAQVAEVAVVGKTVSVRRVCCAFDCGQQIDPGAVAAQLEGGIVFGMTAALAGQITIADGAIVEGNFDAYRMARLAHTPQIDIDLITGEGPIGGAGEAGVPPIAPAIVNAIFAATGKRLRRLPVSANGYQVL